MAARRRSRSRPLTDFAERSPIHAIGVWLFKVLVVGLMFLGLWLVIANWAVPNLVDRFSR